MKKLFITAVWLVGSFQLLLAGTDPAAQQSLATALQRARLFHDQARPLRLDVDFVAHINVPAKGHLTLIWEEKNHWWRRVVMGDFDQVEIRNGDKFYTSRNMGFTPTRVHELIGLLQFAERSEGLLVRKQRNRAENGVEMNCLHVEAENAWGKSHEVCLNSASHEILSDDWQETPDEQRRAQYTDYFDFEGQRYPHKLELVVNGSKVITANVASLTTAAFDPSLLLPPKGAIERRHCADMKHAFPIKQPDPLYPKSAKENSLAGDTTVAMTVLTDGSVTDIQLVGSAGRSMDDATLQTLKTWRFKPATCGAEPVVSDIMVVVRFRLR